LRGSTLIGAGVLWVAACSNILDIQDAETDPLLLEGGNGGEGGGTGGEGGQSPDELCESYCQLVEATCTDDNDVWASATLCNLYCAYLPPGAVGDMAGNTVGCRLYNAERASVNGELDLHCPIAGPGGNGVCGSNCEAYCLVMSQACSSRFNEDHDGIADCIQDCNANVPDLGGYDASIQEGDSIQCRLYHLSAATDDPGLHCAHAAGDAPCRDNLGGSGGTGGGGGAGGAGGN
jgi:hypothetical protein